MYGGGQDPDEKGPFDLELLLHKGSNYEIKMSHLPDCFESLRTVLCKAYPSNESRMLALI